MFPYKNYCEELTAACSYGRLQLSIVIRRPTAGRGVLDGTVFSVRCCGGLGEEKKGNISGHEAELADI